MKLSKRIIDLFIWYQIEEELSKQYEKICEEVNIKNKLKNTIFNNCDS